MDGSLRVLVRSCDTIEDIATGVQRKALDAELLYSCRARLQNGVALTGALVVTSPKQRVVQR